MRSSFDAFHAYLEVLRADAGKEPMRPISESLFCGPPV